MFTFALVKQNNGAIAQLVEQRTENPCVPGSIPGGTTENQAVTIICDCFFVFMANEFVCVIWGRKRSVKVGVWHIGVEAF